MSDAKTSTRPEEDLRRFKFKWTLPRMLVQLISLVAVNALVLTQLFPNMKIQPIPFGLPILASVNSHFSAIYSSFDLMQLELAQPEFPFIVVGTVLLIGAVVGRAFCGWVCPIGFIQDMITTLKGRLDFVSPRTQKGSIRIKYVLLFATLLISASLAIALATGAGSDFKAALGILATGPFIVFSPDATLFGTVPALIGMARDGLSAFLAKPPTMQEVYNWITTIPPLLAFRVLILAAFFGAAWKVPRFFCRYICPTGALMAIFQKYSLSGMKRDPVKCTKCPHCEIKCPMQINILDLPWEKFNDPECIMCMECVDACPHGSLSPKFG
ncbi:MAG TPA: 4Fe-4S binding protein [Candidatus Acidoferrales bacterium]|nr:4Fe-4S binding protein [Candidatus Acidoferrales bacterium]